MSNLSTNIPVIKANSGFFFLIALTDYVSGAIIPLSNMSGFFWPTDNFITFIPVETLLPAIADRNYIP